MSGIDTPQFVPDDPDAGAGKTSRPGHRGRRPREPWFGKLGQLDFDIDFFGRILARKADSLEALRVLAELVSKKGDHERAVELDGRLVSLLPDDSLARYNLACSLARAGRPDDAIDALSRAILLGYDDLDHMESDPDLESLHEHPDFQALLGDEA
jgi:tetratricopeptide (TPR) repeat protein